MISKIGIFYHAEREATYRLAQELKEQLSEYNVWLAPPVQEEAIIQNLPGTDLVFSLGGDGTLLRVVQATFPYSVPVLGINLGQLGFITELTPQELKDKLPQILSGEGWIEERSMLQAILKGKVYHALNDIVLARGNEIKLIYIKVTIDGKELTTYKTDGVILATATGSTAYNLSVGGPILYPWSRDFILKPIYAHLGFPAALVLSAETQVELELLSKQAILGIDGQFNISVKGGEKVQIKISPFSAKLLRLKPREAYYQSLGVKLLGR